MPPSNEFANRGALDSAHDAAVVTPHNATDFIKLPRAIWVGGAGNVACEFPSGTVLIQGVPAGTLLPIRPSRINATNTTATLMVALF
jgi:hypothetical protein